MGTVRFFRTVKAKQYNVLMRKVGLTESFFIFQAFFFGNKEKMKKSYYASS